MSNKINKLPSAQIEFAADNARFDEKIESMSDKSFGPGRFAKAASLLREDNSCIYSLSRIALLQDSKAPVLVGSCRIWPIIDGNNNSAYFLGPIIVDENHRGQSIGAGLVGAVTGACAAESDLPIILVGDLPFFGRFGFAKVPSGLLSLPAAVNPERLLWKGSGEICLSGRLRRPR